MLNQNLVKGANTHSVEPELGERGVVELIDPLGDGDPPHVFAALFLVLLGLCVNILSDRKPHTRTHGPKRVFFEVGIVLETRDPFVW